MIFGFPVRLPQIVADHRSVRRVGLRARLHEVVGRLPRVHGEAGLAGEGPQKRQYVEFALALLLQFGPIQSKHGHRDARALGQGPAGGAREGEMLGRVGVGIGIEEQRCLVLDRIEVIVSSLCGFLEREVVGLPAVARFAGEQEIVPGVGQPVVAGTASDVRLALTNCALGPKVVDAACGRRGMRGLAVAALAVLLSREEFPDRGRSVDGGVEGESRAARIIFRLILKVGVTVSQGRGLAAFREDRRRGVAFEGNHVRPPRSAWSWAAACRMISMACRSLEAASPVPS